MGLTKNGYQETYSGTVTEKLGVDSNGYITFGTADKTKQFNFKYANAGNTADENHYILETFASIISGDRYALAFDDLTNSQNVKFSVR